MTMVLVSKLDFGFSRVVLCSWARQTGSLQEGYYCYRIWEIVSPGNLQGTSIPSRGSS